MNAQREFDNFLKQLDQNKEFNEKWADSGLRKPPQLEGFKGYQGWVAVALWKLTDQEVAVFPAGFLNSGTTTRNSLGGNILSQSRRRESEDAEGYCSKSATQNFGKGFMAFYKYKYDVFQSQQEDGEEDIRIDEDAETTWGLLDINGFSRILVGEVTKTAMRVLYPPVKLGEEGSSSHGKSLYGRVIRGDPDDLDALARADKKQYGFDNKNESSSTYTQWTVNLDQKTCPENYSMTDEEGFYGKICAAENYSLYHNWGKLDPYPIIRARVVDLITGKCHEQGKNPWRRGWEKRERLHIHELEGAEDDPDAKWEWRKDKKPVLGGGPQTYNCVALEDGQEEQELILPSSEGRLFPRIPARIKAVLFLYLGCLPDEVECSDGCCLDCCKLGKSVLQLLS